MSLVEIERYTDVYEADLAAAFLASHGIEVSVTERFQTTINPLLQRALGIRLMGRADQVEAARDLLAGVSNGEFADPVPLDELAPRPQARTMGRGIALMGMLVTGYPATTLPRRMRPVQIIGFFLLALVVLGAVLAAVS